MAEPSGTEVLKLSEKKRSKRKYGEFTLYESGVSLIL